MRNVAHDYNPRTAWNDDAAANLREMADIVDEWGDVHYLVEYWEEHPAYPGVELRDDGTQGRELVEGYPAADLVREIRARGGRAFARTTRFRDGARGGAHMAYVEVRGRARGWLRPRP